MIVKLEVTGLALEFTFLAIFRGDVMTGLQLPWRGTVVFYIPSCKVMYLKVPKFSDYLKFKLKAQTYRYFVKKMQN